MSTAETVSFVTAADDEGRLDLLVARRLDLSRTQAATLIAGRHVHVDGRLEKASYRPQPGERVDVVILPAPGRAVVGEDIPIPVLFEDEHLLVVDKPAGMVVHPAPGNWTGTLVNALIGRGGGLSLASGEERAGLVHRLDKETSGLLVVAKTERAHRILGAALAARRIDRRYAALSWGHLSSDMVDVDRPIGRDPRDRTRMTILTGGRAAVTSFRRLARYESTDVLRARLHSGRTHQIRVHLASIGHPVVGDDVYGGGGARKILGLPPKRHCLHAAWLRFRHPESSAPLDFRSPLPEDLDRVFRTAAGKYPPPASSDLLEHLAFFADDE